MLRSVIYLALIAVLLVFSGVEAQDEGFGLGVILGEPTGISGKLWTGDRTAIDGAVAWSFEDKTAVHLHADFLFHKFDHIEPEKGEFSLYYGIGGRIKFEDDSKAGVRFPGGINYLFPEAPLDLFVEIVPLLDLAPSTKFRFNAALGIRYFFGQRGY